MSHMGQGPPKSSKRYINDLFEKSVPIMVTYLCKVLSKLYFPEGDTYQPPPRSYRVNQNTDYLGKKKSGAFYWPLTTKFKILRCTFFHKLYRLYNHI